MKILILKTDFFRKKNMNTIFVGSSYDIYVLAGFCDQIPLNDGIDNYQKKPEHKESVITMNLI